MTDPEILVEIWRGDMVESQHRGHAVIIDDTGQVIAAWGDPDKVIYPRSSAKMLQALPLVESGAAGRAHLSREQLALSCASHQGAAIHTTRVARWLADIGMSETDLRCGTQVPNDREERHRLRDGGECPSQLHNNCSGKHAGFLTLGRDIGAGPEYVEPDHPIQKAVRAAFEEITGETSPRYAIDGCSAPNFACTVTGLARAMAHMAAPDTLSGARARASSDLVGAMAAHPDLVAGEGRACTGLIRAAGGRAIVKTGAEGVFVGILPEQRHGIALKIEDGATRASESAMAALLVRTGVVAAEDPEVMRWMHPEILNRRDILTGHVKPARTLFDR